MAMDAASDRSADPVSSEIATRPLAGETDFRRFSDPCTIFTVDWLPSQYAIPIGSARNYAQKERAADAAPSRLAYDYSFLERL